MAGNFRVFYPIETVSFSPMSASGNFSPIHGLQSVNMTTAFQLEQVFELGQLDIYSIVEGIPNIEMTLEKVIDGYPLMYHMASKTATSVSLLNRTTQRTDVVLSIFSDLQDNASGTPLTQAYCSGMYINSLNYSLPLQGNLTERLGLVGNDKLWKVSPTFYFNGQFTGGDAPASGVQRRWNVVMGSAPTGSVWPTSLPGITVVNGSGYNVDQGTQFGVHINNADIACNLGRTDLFELGRKRPYFRYANFPVNVTATLNVITAGTTPGDLINANADISNLVYEPIVVKLQTGTVFDLGNKNKLLSVAYTGGSTGGEPVTVAYNYENFNKLDVHDPADPAGLG